MKSIVKATVTNNNTGRSYEVWGTDTRPVNLDLVWASQKCWFSPGASVTIADMEGNSKTFRKE